MGYFVKAAFFAATTAANRHPYSPVTSPVSILHTKMTSYSSSDTSTAKDDSKTGVLGIDFPELVSPKYV
jgi:hypothetical protein